MGRTLRELIAIADEIKAIYADYTKARADGVSLDEGLELADKVLAVLNKHKVTLEELQELLVGIRPILALVR